MGDRIEQIAAGLPVERMQKIEDFCKLGNEIAAVNRAFETTTRGRIVVRYSVYRKPISAALVSFEPQTEFS